MLRSTSCKNITPFPRKESYFEFWTRAEDESKNKETFRYLYENGFLNLYPDQQQDSIPKFWKCFKESLKNNNKGSNGIQCILSIIAQGFSYKELQDMLNVSSSTINDARKYSRINGAGGVQLSSPK
ncbi:11155_t:CDS:2 [Entrophospora sp. SA101]|nr:11155_t:CDS:2 [Entrophospora sp. SA101]